MRNTKLLTYRDVDHIADLDWNPDGSKLAIIGRNQTIRTLHPHPDSTHTYIYKY